MIYSKKVMSNTTNFWPYTRLKLYVGTLYNKTAQKGRRLVFSS